MYMPIIDISETVNENIRMGKPIKERMDIFIPGVPEGVSRRNGMIYLLVGSGGSGKTNTLLQFFRTRGVYNKKFHHLYYFCPAASFASVRNHPFEKHDKVYHELNMDILSSLRDELMQRKEEAEEDDEPEYSCCIIDDFANNLKDKEILKMLNSMLIKARHLNCSFIFTLQSFLYMPRILRKQTTFCTIFRPRNSEEWETLRKEILQMKDDDAKKIFDYCFNEPYQHLDVDCFENKFYKNFNLLNIRTDSDI